MKHDLCIYLNCIAAGLFILSYGETLQGCSSKSYHCTIGVSHVIGFIAPIFNIFTIAMIA